MGTGHPGIFAGGDMIGGARTMTAAVGHGKKAARNIDAWLRGETFRNRRSTRSIPFESLNLPVFLDAERREQERNCRSRSARVRRGGRGLVRARSAIRGQPLPFLRQLLRMRQLLRRLSRAGDHQARQGPLLPLRLRPLHGLRRVLRAVPLPRDRDAPGARRAATDAGRSRENAVPAKFKTRP